MKLTFHNRTEALGSRYEEADPSNEPNRPHISSDTRDFKERETKSTEGAVIFQRAPPHLSLVFIVRLVGLSPVWRPVPRLSAAGEGVSTDQRRNPQELFSGFLRF
ncbi:hypothetical protein [Brevirhabdus pacifica]|uniref:hypothetical protein n=1 Tax=Brevirhabdus pacifica TaxID=1267768 RepID=UPI000C24C918|nr:hypothetical protein [Brevirhabdus pacifica]